MGSLGEDGLTHSLVVTIGDVYDKMIIDTGFYEPSLGATVSISPTHLQLVANEASFKTVIYTSYGNQLLISAVGES